MHNDSDDQIGKAGSTGHAAAKRAEVGRARFHVAAQKDAALAAGGKPNEADAARMVAEFHAKGCRVTVCPPADEAQSGDANHSGGTA